MVYSGLKCGQTAARGISLVSRCPCVRSDDGSRMSSRVSVPRGPASRRLPPRQLPPRPRPTRGGPPVPDVPCPGRCNNLVLTLFTQYNRVVPSSIGRVDYIRYLTSETTERSCAMKSHHLAPPPGQRAASSQDTQPSRGAQAAEALRPTRDIAHRRTRQSHSDIYRTCTGTLPTS